MARLAAPRDGTARVGRVLAISRRSSTGRGESLSVCLFAGETCWWEVVDCGSGMGRYCSEMVAVWDGTSRSTFDSFERSSSRSLSCSRGRLACWLAEDCF